MFPRNLTICEVLLLHLMVLFSISGLYTLEVTASGQISGANFERKDTLNFEVVGEGEIREAYFAGLLYNRDYAPGDINNLESPPANQNYYLDLLNAKLGVWIIGNFPVPNRFGQNVYTV